ncbi:MAG: glycosyltransferase family 39 protein [Candidatus Omnitrophota bacterium]|nr:glycosyltransferase family 39 protein [Candidatus Omnitrophota bacterium]
MPKTSKKNINVWAILASLIAAAILIRIPLMVVRANVLPGDEVMLGIMGRQILQGKFPIFYLGQSYLGALAAYVTALLSLVLGMNGWTVQLATFLFYLLFMGTHFFIVKRIFGLASAVYSSLFLVFASVMFSELSVRALGGYNEILFLGALAFLLWCKVVVDKNHRYLFPLGLTLGVGCWVNPLVVVYIIPLICMTLYWHEGFRKRLPWIHPVKLFWVRDFKIPLWLKIPFILVHIFAVAYILKQIYVFFAGTWEAEWLGFDFTRPPFHFKGLRRMALLLGIEALCLVGVTVGIKNSWQFIRRHLGLLLGFLVGFMPSVIHAIAGGEGYRILQGSSAISAQEVTGKLAVIFLKLIPIDLWGFPRPAVSPGLFQIIPAALAVVVFLTAFLLYFYDRRRELFSFITLTKGIGSEGFFFCLLTVSILLITFVSSLIADRYLAPLCWVTAVVAGVLFAKLDGRFSYPAKGLLAVILCYYFVAGYRYVVNYPRDRNIHGLVRVLEGEKIPGGATDYDNAYRLNFYSHGRLKFLPLEGMLRNKEDRALVNGWEQKALVFFADTHREQFFAAHPDLKVVREIAYEEYSIFVIEGPTAFRM